MNRDLARQSFEQWYNAEYIRPIIPADRTEGGYQHPDAQSAWDAWQAAISHAKGEAVGEITIDKHGDAHFRASLGYLDLDQGTYELYTHPAPQVAVPEAVKERVVEAIAEALGDAKDCIRVWTAWGVGTMGPDDFLDVAGDPDRLDEIAEAAITAMLAAAPAAPAGELVTRCTAGLGCDEKGYCDAAATGQGDLCDRRTMAHEQPVSDPDGLGAERARRLETATVAKLLLNAWAESEPDHPVTKHPASYAETFTDMAKAMMPLMAAPDEREIAALLERIVPRIDPQNPKPLDEIEHCCECTLYYERERIHDEIARLRKLGGNHD